MFSVSSSSVTSAPRFQVVPVFSPLPPNSSPLHRFPQFTCNSQLEKEKVEVGSTSRMFMLGFGYVGQSFAHELKKENWKISGTCMSTTKKMKLEDMGFDVQLFSAKDEELGCLNSLAEATHVLVSIPPVVDIGDPVLYQHWNLLRSQLFHQNLQWLCYLSSTSVYGDCGGAWVDEDYPPKPTKESAKARLLAEKGWLSLGPDLGISVQVLRLGGIYGPGRSALDTIIKKGLLTESQRMREAKHYTTRIHVADICQALKATISKPSFGRIYNVVDDDPASREEVFAFAHNLIETKWPGQTKVSKLGLIRQDNVAKGEKRVSNARLKNKLGMRLLYPTYKSGLESIIESMENPFL